MEEKAEEMYCKTSLYVAKSWCADRFTRVSKGQNKNKRSIQSTGYFNFFLNILQRCVSWFRPKVHRMNQNSRRSSPQRNSQLREWLCAISCMLYTATLRLPHRYLGRVLQLHCWCGERSLANSKQMVIVLKMARVNPSTKNEHLLVLALKLLKLVHLVFSLILPFSFCIFKLSTETVVFLSFRNCFASYLNCNYSFLF